MNRTTRYSAVGAIAEMRENHRIYLSLMPPEREIETPRTLVQIALDHRELLVPVLGYFGLVVGLISLAI